MAIVRTLKTKFALKGMVECFVKLCFAMKIIARGVFPNCVRVETNCLNRFSQLGGSEIMSHYDTVIPFTLTNVCSR